jgi:hypothetical protein
VEVMIRIRISGLLMVGDEGGSSLFFGLFGCLWYIFELFYILMTYPRFASYAG